jgi:FkbM family methyltransferase
MSENIAVIKDENVVKIINGDRIILVKTSHEYYKNDYISAFDYFFDAVKYEIIDGVRIVDYTKLRKHKVNGFDLHEIYFPTMPEPACTSKQYADFGILSGNEIVLDLGAYAGLTAILFDQAIADRGGTGRVIAVEADEDNYNALKLNTDLYKRTTDRDITIIYSAIWRDNCGVNFEMDADMGSAVDCFSGPRQKTKFIPSCTLTSLSDKLNLNRVDFIKCDIEGAENVIFSDANFFAKYNPRIVVEVHDYFVPGTTDNVIKTLSYYGYKCKQTVQCGVEIAGYTLLECVRNFNNFYIFSKYFSIYCDLEYLKNRSVLKSESIKILRILYNYINRSRTKKFFKNILSRLPQKIYDPLRNIWRKFYKICHL